MKSTICVLLSRIIIMAGDSAIVKSINTIIDMEVQKSENLGVAGLEDIKKLLLTPFCFIPVGSTNMIASTIYGISNNDYATPLRYLIHGIKMRIDMSAVFVNVDRLQYIGFNYSCGIKTSKNV
jgi:diacylglycerol kinase family enzyme